MVMKENNWYMADGQIPNPNQHLGFVYQIIERDTDIRYIGIKKYWEKVTLKPLKGKKNKRHKLVESDWKTYNTSSKLMQEKLESNPKNYVKEILYECDSVTDMKAIEAFIQLNYYNMGVWYKLYNEMINVRLRIRK